MPDQERKAPRKRSLMLLQQKLCNGELTGRQCVHYWEVTQPMDVENPSHMKRGETSRYCTMIQIGAGPFDFGEAGAEMPTKCNRYEKSKRIFEPIPDYNPLTPEEILELDSKTEEELNEEYGAHAFDLNTFAVTGLGAQVDQAPIEDENND